jgi:prophage regulatory protein
MSSEPARTPSRILRLRTVVELTGLSRSTIYLRIAKGDFPRQVSLGGRAIGWRESDVYSWLEALQEKG